MFRMLPEHRIKYDRKTLMKCVTLPVPNKKCHCSCKQNYITVNYTCNNEYRTFHRGNEDKLFPNLAGRSWQTFVNWSYSKCGTVTISGGKQKVHVYYSYLVVIVMQCSRAIVFFSFADFAGASSQSGSGTGSLTNYFELFIWAFYIINDLY